MQSRILICCGLCCLTSVPVNVQADPNSQSGSSMTLKQLQQTKRSTGRHKEMAPISVQPAAEPAPSLRYRFYPTKWEQMPGQALLHFSRAQILFAQESVERKKLWQSDAWQDDALDNGPTDDQLKAAVDTLRPLYDELHQLAMSDDFRFDHRIRDLRGSAVYSYLLPDVQESRALARMLMVRIRYQLSKKDFDGAITSIGDGVRLAEFVGQGESLIQKLVGIAIASMMRDRITKLISTPGCPNLYWALATIPQPLVDVSDSVLWELNNITNVLPELRKAEMETWTVSEADRNWASINDDLAILSGFGTTNENEFRVALAVASVTSADTARKRLLKGGVAAKRVKTLPTLQIILMDTARELQRLSDDLGKAHLLPTSLARPLIRREQERFEKWVDQNRAASVAVLISGLLYPAVGQAQEAETRMDMSFNRLMTLEALRMHAAGHEGQVPGSLDQLEPVPAFPDAYTGRSFDYRVDDVDGHQVLRLEAEGPTTYLPLKVLRARVVK